MEDRVMTCGHCGKTWNDKDTPTPAGRCPYEREHDIVGPETYYPIEADGFPYGTLGVYVDENMVATFEMIEPLHFHKNYSDGMFDYSESGPLDVIQRALHFANGVDPDAVAVEYGTELAWGEDEETLTITVQLGDIMPHTTETELINDAWPIAANVLNITDPGTFGAPYIYSQN